MTMNKAALLALISSALLAGSAYASDEGRKGAHGRHFNGPGFGMPQPGLMIQRMADRLELDDDQRQSVQNIMSAARPEIEALREQLRANHEALQSLGPDDPELQNIAMSNGALATEGTLLFARIRSDIDAVLTDDQRTKLAELKDRKRDRAERRQQRR